MLSMAAVAAAAASTLPAALLTSSSSSGNVVALFKSVYAPVHWRSSREAGWWMGGKRQIEHTIGVLPHSHHCKGEGQSAAEKRAGYATLLCYSTHAVPVSVALFVTFSEQRQWKGKNILLYLFLPPKECGNKRETTRTKCEGCSHRRRDLRVLFGGSGRHRVGSTYIFPKVCNSWDASECALKRSWQFNRLVPSF